MHAKTTTNSGYVIRNRDGDLVATIPTVGQHAPLTTDSIERIARLVARECGETFLRIFNPDGDLTLTVTTRGEH